MRSKYVFLLYMNAFALAAAVDTSSSCFDMKLERSAVYTPGTVQVTARLGEGVRMGWDLHFRMSVFVADMQVGEKTLTVQGGAPSIFQLEISAQRDRVDARCRVELFMDGQFVEAREAALSLWPPAAAYPNPFADEAIWVYDLSGRLQDILLRLDIEIADAGSPAAGLFNRPAAVFFGEEADVAGISRVRHSLERFEKKPVLVFLRQADFPKEIGMKIVSAGDCAKVDGRMRSVLLEGLCSRDLLPLLRGVAGVRIVSNENEFVLAEPVLSLGEQDKRLSYLGTVERRGYRHVYCQLPIVEDFAMNPVCGVLLRNMIASACGEVREHVPVIYDPLVDSVVLEPAQLAEILAGAPGIADRKIWFVHVTSGAPGGRDRLRGRVYCRPDYSSARLRKGTFFCFDEDDDVAAEQSLDQPAAACEYCQVSLPGREFAFQLEVPSYGMGLPFSRGKEVSDEEIVEAVDAVRSMGAGGRSYSGYKGNVPIMRIDEKDGLIEVKTGMQKEGDRYAGHILTLRKSGTRYELVNIAPWAY